MSRYEIYRELAREFGIPEAETELEAVRRVALSALSSAIAGVVTLKDPLDPVAVDSIAAELLGAAETIRKRVEESLAKHYFEEAALRDAEVLVNFGTDPCPECGKLGEHLCRPPDPDAVYPKAVAGSDLDVRDIAVAPHRRNVGTLKTEVPLP